MPRLVLILAIAAVVFILYKRAQGMPPHKRKAELLKLGVGVAVVVVIGLALTGRMHWIGVALTGLLVTARQLLPTLVRLFPMLASLRGRGAPNAGQSSTVETAVLRMQLDHDNGKLEGEVLQGSYRGWRLADMDKNQLLALQEYCRDQGADTTQLLDSYLKQRFVGDSTFDQGHAGPATTSAMSSNEALAVLGLDEGATKDDIVTAHRKLMQKIHPDRGGNDYLAAKLNQAKDLLLG